MMIRKILPLLLFSFILFSCANDDDINTDTIGQTFEISNVDFITTDGFQGVVNVVVPNNISVFESDVPLVFILDPAATAANGVDVFEPLPRSFFFNNGGFAQYRFNFIFDDATGIFDLDLVLESDDFDALGNDFTQNQIFRIVIVPSEFAETHNTDNLNTVLSELNLD
ncbi:hypothetical protein GCM10011344_37620 [Dokdonia pacifica]|uniref:Collagen-like protein n=1 Tax=Dokdonia pacifica TaxID=1627892 RepID=A0A239B4X5_9FLAO|nr:hypothetical protein [Dokdonia pacifica]GGG33197.1 hypothetical protein GCM10011344_37620 [Dokdonia pacifica]SNS02248.1 hypothetical protein SAMN06265376_105308 [Dokdonia pacifica]